MNHIYQNSNFGQDWFTYPNLYKSISILFPSGSKFVEVGSWKGKSAAFMAVEIINLRKNIEFFCVDTWEGSVEHEGMGELPLLYDIFRENMKPLEGHYTPMKMSSIEASKYFSDKSLDFVFLDASHEYEDVCLDIDAWKPKVKNGGFIAGHDYRNDGVFPGVKKAVDEKIKNPIIYDLEICWISQVLTNI